MTAIFENGELVKIVCNGCGEVVAEEVIVKRGEKEAWKFQRKPTYTEAKVQMSDGSFHIFNGCAKCLENPSAEQLTVWYRKDMEELYKDNLQKLDALRDRSLKREAVRVVQKGLGIP